jgi:hypothetical protein
VVIIAGYPQNTDAFLNSNPGLKSRFDRKFTFEDYAAEEMLTIAEQMFAANGLLLQPEARTVLAEKLSQLESSRDQFFGNGRTVRRIVEGTVKQHNLRMATLAPEARTPAVLASIEVAELQAALADLGAENPTTGIGFLASRMN